jgi:hypothetical protein
MEKSSFLVEKAVGPFGYQVILVMWLTLDPAVQLNKLLYYSPNVY